MFRNYSSLKFDPASEISGCCSFSNRSTCIETGEWIGFVETNSRGTVSGTYSTVRVGCELR